MNHSLYIYECFNACSISFIDLFFWIILYLQAIDHIINSAAKTYYMSAGQISVPIVFRGPNGAAAGVAAQHSQVI
jgi:pyruvate/2-oxoglutarate/acetoin dehydrogenase E1 component